MSQADKIKNYSTTRIVLGALILGGFLEVLTHDKAYIQGGITFGLETMFEDENRSNVDIARVILYGLMALMRIFFEGFGAVMLLPWLVPGEEKQTAVASAPARGIAASEVDSKRER